MNVITIMTKLNEWALWTQILALCAKGVKLGTYSASVLIGLLCSYSASMREIQVVLFWLLPNWLELLRVVLLCGTANIIVKWTGKENQFNPTKSKLFAQRVMVKTKKKTSYVQHTRQKICCDSHSFTRDSKAQFESRMPVNPEFLKLSFVTFRL